MKIPVQFQTKIMRRFMSEEELEELTKAYKKVCSTQGGGYRPTDEQLELLAMLEKEGIAVLPFIAQQMNVGKETVLRRYGSYLLNKNK